MQRPCPSPLHGATLSRELPHLAQGLSAPDITYLAALPVDGSEIPISALASIPVTTLWVKPVHFQTSSSIRSLMAGVRWVQNFTELQKDVPLSFFLSDYYCDRQCVCGGDLFQSA